MKIAIVSDAIYPYNKGGKETRTFELSTRLARNGHDVHIYTMKWWDGSEKTRRENGVTLHAISPKLALYHDERRSIAQGILFGLSTLRLISESFDVVDVDHMPYFPLFFMRVVCLLKRKPMIATWHEVWGRDYWREYLGRMGWIASAMEHMSVHMPDKIVAVSPHTADRLGSILGARRPVSRVANGIDWQAISDIKPSTETSDLVYVGRLLAHKNVDLLVRAVAILARISPAIRCMIISDGPERTNLERLSQELGISRNVVFKGFVSSDKEKLSLMKASRVFVLPSTREGFGIVALEAIACGLPVVTVNHPDNAATHLITPETGRLAEPTPESMASAISEVLRQDTSACTAQTAQSYDWDKSARALAEVYAQ
ncbi:MAG TPA: glycosyltransferase family 4 protein [Candidatus Saccharimonadia bacterium]|nr:glycosyltransferase family 4 protein [Candidatus Saccharimonadia bacterium]